MTWHEFERSALVEALTTAGPDAPTLCEGWRSRHLAAHVIIRESAPLLAAGVVVPALAGRTERAIDDLAADGADARGYAALVAKVAAGPPRWSPLGWAGDSANLLEFFVHTEDVRRGAGLDTPRELATDHTLALWQRLVRTAPMLYRRASCGVVLVVPGGPRRAVRRAHGDAGTVVVRGDVGELILHAFGRGTAARVHVLGEPTDLATLGRATGV